MGGDDSLINYEDENAGNEDDEDASLEDDGDTDLEAGEDGTDRSNGGFESTSTEDNNSDIDLEFLE